MKVSQLIKEVEVVELDPLRVYENFRGEDSYILESAEGGEKVARYSILGVNPALSFRVKDGKTSVVARVGALKKTVVSNGNPIVALKEVMEGMTQETSSPNRFAGGFVGYLSYDYIRYLVDVGEDTEDALKQPDAEFSLSRNNIVFDHVEKKIYLIANVFGESDEDEAKESLDELAERFNDLPLDMPDASSKQLSFNEVDYSSNMSQHEYEEGVRKSREYIHAGDIFQVVLSQRLNATYKGDSLQVYSALKNINPSPYMYYLDLGERKIVGSSPEMLTRVEGRKVLTYPIAGTRSRGKTMREDENLAKDMKECEKERAEHVMLVDLGRNDLGRVSRFGSVRVNKFMGVEKYSHVQHMVSEVEGVLREDCDCFDALNAVFPAGTVSGAPKVRAMEIIDELESERRGIYAGCVGYASFNANMDTAITIRTLVFEGDTAYAQAGAGIVADSIPTQEYKETLKKAGALIKALGYE